MGIFNNIVRGTMFTLALASCKTTTPGSSGLKDDPPADAPPPPQIKSPFGENDFEEIKGQYTGVMEQGGRPCSITILNQVEDWRILRELDVTFTQWRRLIPNSPFGSTIKESVYFSEPKIGPNTCKTEKEACGEPLSAHKDNRITLMHPVYADADQYELRIVDINLKDKIPVSFTYDEQMPVVFGRGCDRLMTRRSQGDYMMKCLNLKKVGN
jgi:hypothetical protein